MLRSVAVTIRVTTTSSVVPMGVVAPAWLEWQWPPYAPPSRDSLGGLVPSSHSVRKMGHSRPSSAGDPLATAGVWRALVGDRSLREWGENQTAQVSYIVIASLISWPIPNFSMLHAKTHFQRASFKMLWMGQGREPESTRTCHLYDF